MTTTTPQQPCRQSVILIQQHGLFRLISGRANHARTTRGRQAADAHKHMIYWIEEACGQAAVMWLPAPAAPHGTSGFHTDVMVLKAAISYVTDKR